MLPQILRAIGGQAIVFLRPKRMTGRRPVTDTARLRPNSSRPWLAPCRVPRGHHGVAPVKKRRHHPRPPTPACPPMRRDLTKQLDRSHQFVNGTRRRSRVRDRPARRRSRPRHPQAKRHSGPGGGREAGSASRKYPRNAHKTALRPLMGATPRRVVPNHREGPCVLNCSR